MSKATVVRVDGTTKELDHRPTLNEAQEIVGGYVEFVRCCPIKPQNGKVVILVVDEEGKIKNKPANHTINQLYGPSMFGDYIVGDVIVLEGWRTVGG